MARNKTKRIEGFYRRKLIYNMAKKEKSEEVIGDVSIKQLDAYLKANKKDHLNYDEQVNWVASTGSLEFDAELGGGFGPGAYKVAGASFAGKTNCVLQCVKNALETIPNSKGLWVKAEGRLDQEVQDRSGVKFVYKAEEWQVGTCFVLETNIFELVTDLINNLIKNNPSEIRYVMGIDSMDGLIRRADMEKDAEEGERVGGGALLTSVMFKKANLVLNKKGHVLFMIHQIRAKIETNQYAPKDQNKSVGGGGANSGVHSSNQVWNFRGRTKQVNIEEKGKVVGHYCVVDLTKGVKEQIDIRVQYPVKHGMKGGKSVWLEKEIADLLVQWELVEKAGSWLKFEKDFILELRSQGFSVGEEKINKETSEKIYEFSVQGDAKLKDWLEENPAITDYLYKKFLKMFTEE